jgi:hypothetical protein
VLHFLALLGIVEGNDSLAQMDANIRKRRTLDALKQMLLRESLNQPLMVMFEDLHCAPARFARCSRNRPCRAAVVTFGTVRLIRPHSIAAFDFFKRIRRGRLRRTRDVTSYSFRLGPRRCRYRGRRPSSL